VGTFLVPGPGFRAAPPLHSPHRPAPTLGEHTDELARELGVRRTRLDHLREIGVV
jgi:crotonobetainyl-CoA:carnitine CoA-transferase CaiB-like acyl-CoA transferase